jgi:hypothetical protein
MTALAQELSLSFFFLNFVKIRLRKAADAAGEEPKQEPPYFRKPRKRRKKIDV